MFQADDIDFNIVQYILYSFGITCFKVNAVNGSQDFDSKRRDAHPKNFILLKKCFRGNIIRVGTKKLLNNFRNFPRIGLINSHPYIYIGSCARKAVISNRIPSDEEILNLF